MRLWRSCGQSLSEVEGPAARTMTSAGKFTAAGKGLPAATAPVVVPSRVYQVAAGSPLPAAATCDKRRKSDWRRLHSYRLAYPPQTPYVFSMSRPQTISFWRGALPHWEVVDGRYFVTVRLANSLPAGVESELAAILNDATEENYTARSRTYFRTLERWLDANQGHAFLAERDVAETIAEAISAYERRDLWRVSAYAIMPNHVHLFLRCGSIGLGDLMRRFKHATSRIVHTVSISVAAGSPLPAAMQDTSAGNLTTAGKGLPAATAPVFCPARVYQVAAGSPLPAAMQDTSAGNLTAAGKGLPAATTPVVVPSRVYQVLRAVPCPQHAQ